MKQRFVNLFATTWISYGDIKAFVRRHYGTDLSYHFDFKCQSNSFV